MPELLNPVEETRAQLIDLKKIREAHRQHLAQLQVRAAQFGIDTPPHVTNEIEDVDRQLAEVNRRIALLEGALPAQLQQLEPPPPDSLYPITVVPATINERLLVITMELVRMQDEMRKNFQALHMAQQKDTESLWHALTDARDAIDVERDERREWQEQERLDREDWQDGEQASRRYRQRITNRWLWAIGIGLVLLFVLVVILAATDDVRDVLLNRTGK